VGSESQGHHIQESAQTKRLIEVRDEAGVDTVLGILWKSKAGPCDTGSGALFERLALSSTKLSPPLRELQSRRGISL